jgi:hypothetical protein
MTQLYFGFDVDEEVWLTREDVANGEDTVVKRAIQWINNLAYAHNVTGDKIYLKPVTDEVQISAEVENPNNRTLSVLTYISLNDTTFVDSVYLSNEGAEGEGIWGGSWTPPEENIYHVSVKTEDLIAQTSRTIPNVAHFASAGPVEFDSYEITSSDTLPNPGDRLNLSLYLKNTGSVTTIPNISAQLFTADSVVQYPVVPRDYGDIVAGASVLSLTTYRINFLDNLKESRNVSFVIQIASNGLFYWSDTFDVWVEVPTGFALEQERIPTDFVLNQNYPNPFNPSTTIQFDLPKTSEVSLKIFNILGEEVATLVSDRLSAGSYSYEWDASHLPSGVYLYRLETEDFVETKKMILLR